MNIILYLKNNKFLKEIDFFLGGGFIELFRLKKVYIVYK